MTQNQRTEPSQPAMLGYWGAKGIWLREPSIAWSCKRWFAPHLDNDITWCASMKATVLNSKWFITYDHA